MKSRVCALIFAVVLCLTPGAFAFGIRSSRANMLGGSLALAHPSGTDFLSAPGLVGADRELYFDAGVARRFELSDLDVGYLAVGYRRGNLLFAIGAQQSGSTEFFAEQTARAAFGYRLGIVSAAMTLSARRLEFGGGYAPLSAGALGFGAGIQSRQGSVRVSFDNLNRPSLSESAPEEPRKADIYAELTGNLSYTISANVRFEEDASPDFGLGQTVKLTDFARLSWGISSDPLVYGAGFEITRGRITFIYAGSIHSALGYSQSLTLSVQFSTVGKNDSSAGK